MADGSIVISADIDSKKAQKELTSLTKKIENTEKIIEETQKKLQEAQETSLFKGAELDSEKAKLQEIKDRLREITALSKDKTLSVDTRTGYADQIPFVKEQLADQRTRVQMLQTEYNKIDNSVIRYNENLKNATVTLNEQKERAGELAKEINTAGGASERMAFAAESMSKSMNKFSSRISKLFRNATVFAVMSKGLSSLRTWIGKTITANEEARASIARLKGALLTLAQPIMEVVIPVFTKLVNIITQVVTAIAKFFGMLSGKDFSSQVSAAKSLNAEQEALEGVGAAAEDASKSMAGFDEINQITSDNSTGGGAAGGTSSGAEGIAPDFSNLDMTEDKLNTILGIVGAIAVGLLAWKIASLFTDDLSKVAGIALGAAGAFALVYFWLDAWNNGIDLTNFLGMLGGLVALAGGLAIAFGSTAAGIALVVGGLAMLVVGVKDVIENGLTLENTLTIVSGLLAGGLGISLLTKSWIPMLIAGVAAALLSIVYFTGHGEELITGLKNIADGVGKFFKGVFTGDMELASEGLKQIWEGLKQTWKAITDSLKDLWDMFIEWLKGKNPELAAFFERIGEFVSEMYENVKQILGGLIKFITGVFTGDWKKAWEGVKEIFSGIINGIITAVESAINFLIDGINALLGLLNKINIDFPDWVPLVGGKSFGINIPLIGKIAIPRLAQGAVIPANREFLAVLGDQKNGTNIETPLSTMVQAFKQALAESNSGSRTIVMEVGGREFGRVSFDLYNQEATRRGVKLGVK